MHSITAFYSGDTNHLAATSDVLTQQVHALETTTTLMVSPTTSPLPPQTMVTLTATVAAGGTAVRPGASDILRCDGATLHGPCAPGNGAVDGNRDGGTAVYSWKRQP